MFCVVKLKKGYSPVIHAHTASVCCRIVEIIAKVDKATGKEVEKSPSSIKNGESAFVRIMPMKPLSVET